MVNDKKILEGYSKIWNKIKNLSNNEPVYNDKHSKTKIKIYNDRVYTNLWYNKIPEDNEYCALLSVILSDSILANSDEEYYPQIFLEEYKYLTRNRKLINTIKKYLEINKPDNESHE